MPVNKTNDIDAERSVLGAVLMGLDPATMSDLTSMLNYSAFSHRDHQLTWGAISILHDRGDPIDDLTVSQASGVSPSLLATLTNRVSTTANVLHWAKIILELTTKREFRSEMGVVMETPGLSASEELSAAQGAILRLGQGIWQAGASTAREEARTLLSDLQKGKIDPGLSTGLRDLDAKIGGLVGGDINVIAGRPSMGKTALAMGIVIHAVLDEGKPVLMCNLEMTNRQMMQRAISSRARVDLGRLTRGELKPSDYPKMTSHLDQLASERLHLCDKGGMTLGDIRAQAHRCNSMEPLGLLVIDYLQLMEGSGQNTNDKISSISRGMKALAKELNVPVLLLSQLNRDLEKRPNKRPMLSDLRDSGAIEQDADKVIFVYRDERYNPTSKDMGFAELIVGKQRNGPVGTVRVRFDDSYASFRDE